MFKYAQIFNNKVHWIFESDETLEEMYSHRYPRELIFIDITNKNPDIREGWIYECDTFVNPIKQPTPEELLENAKQIKLNDIKNQLSSTDYKCLKFVDGEISQEEYALTKELRKELRQKYNTVENATTIEEVNNV